VAPDALTVIFSQLVLTDFAATLFITFALWLGPDFILASLGLALDARIGYFAESAVGRLLGQGGSWLDDRDAKLASKPPLAVSAVTLALFAFAGLVLERLLLVAFEDSSFVLATGLTLCIGSGLYELIRPPLLTREEFEFQEAQQAEFAVFAATRLRATASKNTHEREVLKAFRRSNSRFRTAEQVADTSALELVRQWMRTQQMSRGVYMERSAAGFLKGVELLEGPDVGL